MDVGRQLHVEVYGYSQDSSNLVLKVKLPKNVQSLISNHARVVTMSMQVGRKSKHTNGNNKWLELETKSVWMDEEAHEK